MADRYFAGFTTHDIAVSGTTIHALTGGHGPPLLLLHGYPETHLMWREVAARLTDHFTIVAPDLRGYGDSGRPPSGADHSGYAKRTMAADQVQLMLALGFGQFALAGHDRGARVAHRLALDHPGRVSRLAILDIVPTLHVYENLTQAIATAYFHWLFLIQPADFPERYIAADPERWLRSMFGRWGTDERHFPDAVVREYLRCFANPESIHATCEDYRAAASIDLAHDRADRERRIECPVLVLCGANGLVGRNYDVLAVWQTFAREVTGQALPCGHFLAEEMSDETAAALGAFIGGAAQGMNHSRGNA